MEDVTTGGSNVAVGRSAGQSMTTGSENTAVGYKALNLNTTATCSTACGHEALMKNTAINNVAVGHRALEENTTAAYNTAVGTFAGDEVTVGQYNTLIGYTAGSAQTTAADNTFVGSFAGLDCTSGGTNTAVGYYAGSNLTTGGPNNCFGYNAGRYINSGAHNVCIGNHSASYVDVLTTGSFNVYLGSYSRASGAAVTHEKVIGYNQPGKGSETFYVAYADSGSFTSQNVTTWSTTSDRRIKKNIVNNNTGLEVLNKIQVRNFEYRKSEEVDPELHKEATINKEGIQLGVIAQELEEILPNMVQTQTTGCKTVDSSDLTWYLVNAVKELSTEVNTLRTKVATLEAA